MFDFYNLFFKQGYLKIEDLKEACKWNVINKEEFKSITDTDYVSE